MDPIGLYLSVPFCRSKCTYCNFASGVYPASFMGRYVQRLCEDMLSAKQFVSAESVDSIYWGGGTPSLLSPQYFRELFRAIRQQWNVLGHAEITVECAPGQLAEETLDDMLECGVNRISFGVQSFMDQEARAAGRLHTRAIAWEDICRVRQKGVSRVNVDLIAGLPYQTEASWQESLDVLAETGADHASIYMLEVDDDSRLGREVLNGGARYSAPEVPSDDAIAGMYLTAIETLARRGLEQYEISNFARCGAESEHNKKYWLRKPYFGLGVDAHSMLRTEDGGCLRFATHEGLEEYLKAPGWEQRQRLTRQEELEEAWFLGLRLNAGVDLRKLKAEFGAEALSDCLCIIEDLVEEGLLEKSGECVRLTQRGRLLSNDVFARFLVSAPA